MNLSKCKTCILVLAGVVLFTSGTYAGNGQGHIKSEAVLQMHHEVEAQMYFTNHTNYTLTFHIKLSAASVNSNQILITGLAPVETTHQVAPHTSNSWIYRYDTYKRHYNPYHLAITQIDVLNKDNQILASQSMTEVDRQVLDNSSRWSFGTIEVSHLSLIPTKNSSSMMFINNDPYIAGKKTDLT